MHALLILKYQFLPYSRCFINQNNKTSAVCLSSHFSDIFPGHSVCSFNGIFFFIFFFKKYYYFFMAISITLLDPNFIRFGL